MAHKEPQVRILEPTNRYQLKFELSNTELHVANALRRIIISEVPTMAIEIVEVTENTSPLNDEFISHRLGFVPLMSRHVDEFDSHDMCKCEGFCAKCSVRYHLYKKCPPDQDNCDVTSNDIKLEPGQPGINQDVTPVRYTDSKGNEEHPILIMKLSKNQIIDFTLIAKKGIGRKHAKWSPVATCIMRAEPIVELDQDKINQKMSLEHRKELVKRCPRKVFAFKELRTVVEIENADACNLCNECIKFTQEEEVQIDNAITIDEKEDKFIFTVESTGALPPEDIVLKAFEVLARKCKTIQELI